MIRKLGLIKGTEWPWAVSLNDLRVIAEIIDHPTLFLHYLVRRLEVNRIESLSTSDELDFFGHFILRGLFFRDDKAVKSSTHIALDGFTDQLDDYYRALEYGEPATKPRYPLPPRVAELLTVLEEARPRHFATACLDILAYGETALNQMAEQLTHSEEGQRTGRVRMEGMATGDPGEVVLLLFCCVQIDSASESQMIARAKIHKREKKASRCTLIVWQRPIFTGKIRVHLV